MSDLIRQIKERLSEGAKCPSESWMRLQFGPTKTCSKSAMHYIWQFPVKYFVQKRLLRKKYSDMNYCAILL